MTPEKYLEEAARVLTAKPPGNTAQALYLLRQSLDVVGSLNAAIRRLKARQGGRGTANVLRNRAIVDDYRIGMKIRDIAAKHGVSTSRISTIVLKMGGRKHAGSRIKKVSIGSD